MKTNESALWFCAKIKTIRSEAGHDVKKLEALARAPELVAEAATRFPEDTYLAAQVRTAIELELPLAKRGIFLLDGPPTDEQIEALNQMSPCGGRSRRRRQTRGALPASGARARGSGKVSR